MPQPLEAVCSNRISMEDKTELCAPGEYLGQCRKQFNILEQWNGREWRRVPDVIDRRPEEPQKLHFFPPEDDDRYRIRPR